MAPPTDAEGISHEKLARLSKTLRLKIMKGRMAVRDAQESVDRNYRSKDLLDAEQRARQKREELDARPPKKWGSKSPPRKGAHPKESKEPKDVPDPSAQ